MSLQVNDTFELNEAQSGPHQGASLRPATGSLGRQGTGSFHQASVSSYLSGELQHDPSLHGHGREPPREARAQNVEHAQTAKHSKCKVNAVGIERHLHYWLRIAVH